MRCCEAWDPVGECFDPNSFECIDFHALSQIVASLTRESLAEREAEICNLPWTQTENTMPWRSADLDFALGVPRNQCYASTPLPMKTAILWKTKMNQGDYVNIGVQSFGRALKAKGTVTMKTSCVTFRELLTTSAGNSTKTSLTNSWPQRRNLLLALMEFRTAFTGVRGIGLAFSVQRIQTRAGGWYSPCVSCRK